MSSSCSSFYIIIILYIISTNAQEQSIYGPFNFNSLSDGWVVDDEGVDPQSGVLFRGPSNGDSGNCDAIGDGRCLRLEGEAIVSKTISTSGYHQIRIELGIDNNM